MLCLLKIKWVHVSMASLSLPITQHISVNGTTEAAIMSSTTYRMITAHCICIYNLQVGGMKYS